ncbi:MAG TPA: GNAT family N-acetyltransferase [Sideroxyarcus sp.]|nr:GNAT family N-acetyltransferase [Sideroxyarcus sp.]
MRLEEYNRDKHLIHWEAFVATAPMATFLHSRAFLSYHGDRFRDRSLMVYDHDSLVAIFVAAESADDTRIIVSHPGITYGGLLHQGMVGGNVIVEIFQAIISHYKKQGYAGIIYKAIPSFYHQIPCEEDVWALSKLGFENIRTDLGRTISLTAPLVWGDKRQRGLVKSRKAGVTVSHGWENAEALWNITADNLSRKHGLTPVHTLNEIRLLHDLCPDNLDWIVARLGEEAVAGAMLFLTPTVVHVQYGSSSARGYELDALEMVYYKAIEYAQGLGKKYFSFGISTEQEGRILNESLDRFKKKFSAGGACSQSYSLDFLK